MDLERLRLLLQVVDAGGIAKAAAVRGIPQSQVSRHIAALEQDYGGRLLHRTGRGVTLTELGEASLQQMRALLRDADALDAALRHDGRVPRGEVRVGLLSSFVEPMATRFCAAMARELPEVRLKLQEGSSGQLEEALALGRADVGMIIRNQGSQAGDFVLEDAVVLHLIGGPGQSAVAEPVVAFRDLAGLPLVLPGQPSGLRPLLDQAARQQGIALRVAVETDSTAIQLQLAAAGQAFAILGPYAVRTAVRQGRLRAAHIVQPELRRPIGLLVTSVRPAGLAVRDTARILRRMIEETTRPESGVARPLVNPG